MTQSECIGTNPSFPILWKLLFSVMLFYSSAHCQSQWQRGELLYQEDFSDATLNNWVIEVQKPSASKIIAKDGKMHIDVPEGVLVWFKHKLEGDILIQYDMEVIKKGGPNDRVSDLNQFWMASDPKNPNLFTRNGNFPDYHGLLLYYVGMGGANNTTTRFRKYPGDGTRPLLLEHLDKDHLIKANTIHSVQIVCYKGTTQFIVNGEVFFNYKDPKPITAGHFGFRTVQNHETADNFKVYRLVDASTSSIGKSTKQDFSPRFGNGFRVNGRRIDLSNINPVLRDGPVFQINTDGRAKISDFQPDK